MITAAILFFAVLALLGLPLFAVMGGIALAMGMSLGQEIQVNANHIYGQFTASPTLSAIPLFTFAGYLMAEARTGERLVRLFRAWFGWMPASMAVVVVLICAFFTTFTGASGVTIIALGGLLLPMLLKDGYPEKFALGLITGAGSIGLLFPPSLPIIVYGLIAVTDVQRLFVGGILPGLLLLAAMCGYSMVAAARAKVLRTKFDLREAGRSLWVAKWEALLPVIILVLMATGVVSPSESSVIAAAYVLVVEVFLYRDLSLTKDVARIVRESMLLVGAILIIIAAALAMTNWITDMEIPQKLLAWTRQQIDSQVTFLLILNGFLLIVGMLMDIFSAILVVVPLITAIAQSYNIEATHLGIIFLSNLAVGYLTPPFGMNLFLSSLRFNKPLLYLARLSLPYMGVMIVCLALITFIPQITTWLPDTLGIKGRAEAAQAAVEKAGEDVLKRLEEAAKPKVAPRADGGVPAVAVPPKPVSEEDDVAPDKDEAESEETDFDEDAPKKPGGDGGASKAEDDPEAE
jgi:tripartite ATP-independent transporter DctM subunit